MITRRGGRLVTISTHCRPTRAIQLSLEGETIGHVITALCLAPIRAEFAAERAPTLSRLNAVRRSHFLANRVE